MSVNVLKQVRDAHALGASTRKELRTITGLDEEIVDLCVDLLITQGEIIVSDIKGACTIGGCNSCVEDNNCHPRENFSSPVLLNISKRPDLT